MGISKTLLLLFGVLLLLDSAVSQSDEDVKDLFPNSVYQEVISSTKDEGDNQTMCEVLLNKFSDSASEFTECANHFSRPIKMCRACKESSLDVEKFFSALEHSEQRGINCRDLLTGQDKVEVIQETHAFIAGKGGLWDKGYCSECYTKPLQRNSSLTENALTFFALFKSAQDCFETYPNNTNSYGNKSEACSSCYNDYNDLLDFYRETYFSKGDDYQQTGICFDILDSMNSTQLQWGSGYYKCGRTIAGSVPLISSILVVITTPFILYLGVRFGPGATRARERVIRQNTIREIIQEAQEEVNTSQEEQEEQGEQGEQGNREEFILSDSSE